MTTNQHGGSRTGAGRPRSPYRKKLLPVAVKDEEEYRVILARYTPRERTEVLLDARKGDQNETLEK